METHIDMLYAFFWVILRRLNFKCRRFGTLCSVFIADRYPPMKMEQRACFETSAYKIQTLRELPRRKHTTFRTRRGKFEIKNFLVSSFLSSSRFPRDFLLRILRGFAFSLWVCIYHLSQFSQIILGGRNKIRANLMFF
jgi:hypothetical protein